MTKEEMFNQNINLAYKVANKYLINYKHEYEDIKQIALIGLWKAIVKYDEKSKLSTFAYIVIANEINQYLRHVRKHEVSISVNTEIGEDVTLADILKDERDCIAEKENQIEDKELFHILTSNLNNFKEKEKQVLFYAIEGKKQMDIAKRLGISQPQVSRLEKNIAKKLKIKRTSL